MRTGSHRTLDPWSQESIHPGKISFDRWNFDEGFASTFFFGFLLMRFTVPTPPPPPPHQFHLPGGDIFGNYLNLERARRTDFQEGGWGGHCCQLSAMICSSWLDVNRTIIWIGNSWFFLRAHITSCACTPQSRFLLVHRGGSYSLFFCEIQGERTSVSLAGVGALIANYHVPQKVTLPRRKTTLSAPGGPPM